MPRIKFLTTGQIPETLKNTLGAAWDSITGPFTGIVEAYKAGNWGQVGAHGVDIALMFFGGARGQGFTNYQQDGQGAQAQAREENQDEFSQRETAWKQARRYR